ncbi:Isoeugenol synthase 1 [Heracleum sosnowskyi]|uniref:Isoeugenol synthase 1 n=1 Tax=Heracleum sosnowskyi TaxID=360622 RepID=A0AAD8MFY3_9APIA|nr:Isoeugenol synthase 1 [Heracleum sosnowskyi]
MGDLEKKSKILIFGGTGYYGTYQVKACVAAAHPTYVYVRPFKPHHDPSKSDLLQEFKSLGVTIFEGELNEHEKLVEAIRQVDIVIVTLGMPPIMDQLKIIAAMKEAGNVKRFIPSEFGNEVDRISPLPPYQACCDQKKVIRRAAEKSGIPYTFVVANTYGAYFVNYLLRPYDKKSNKVAIYGTGEARFSCNYEKDIAEYTVKVATDPRTENGLIIYRLPKCIITQMDLISIWEKKTGRTMEKTYISEEKLINLSETLPFPDNVPMAILHSLFVKGEEMAYDLKEDDLDVVELYPEYKYTTVEELLDIFLADPPKPVLAAF